MVSPRDVEKFWPWEGRVQDVFVEVLDAHGWTIDSVVNTATKARGIDVVAHKASRTLGAEVKGFPSEGYEDPARAGEKKRTSSSAQAKSWYAKAILAALMLRESQPERESLIVFPDAHRYRQLFETTRSGLTAAAVHVVLLSAEGEIKSTTWAP